MQIKLLINNNTEEDLIVVSLDSSSTISSWLIDNYFTKIYSQQIQHSKKSIQPNNIIGLHDMFIIYQIVHSSSSSEFFQLCQQKIQQTNDDVILINYNKYLQRCGLIDIIDLFHQCQLKSTIQIINFNLENIKNEIDRLFLNYLVEIALEQSISDSTNQTSVIETKENILKLFNQEKNPIEPTISRNYIKHTLCTYLLLLLDTRNEHALVHCLVTPARAGIERQTIVELRRLTKLSKNESLTIYQILLSFIRRKEFSLNRLSDSTDQSFVLLEKSYLGLKEFFDFLEQLQMTIEENEYLKIEVQDTFRKLITSISKQLRKDSSFNRCDLMIKEIIEEFCQSFQTTIPLMDCTSPIRSASSGGTLAGRRFLRSVAYLCAKQIIDLPILLVNNDHYDSPSTGLRKATSSRLLKSPLTPIPIVIDQVIVEEKIAIESPVESVFMWQNEHRFRRRKSQRCLDLSIENSCSSQSSTSRQPLGEIEMNFDERSLSENEKKRVILEPARKKLKKTNTKPLLVGQKMITNFFQSKV